MPRRYSFSAKEIIILSKVLQSEACMHLFKVLSREKSLNISSIVRKTGCKDSVAKKHLKNLVKLGAVSDEWIGGNHVFSIKPSEATMLLHEISIEES